MKALLIAEKPSLMRSIQDAYNGIKHPDDIDFISFVGHIMRLSMPKEINPEWERWNLESLPMIPSTFTYQINNHEIYNNIERKLNQGNYDYVINACDAGREGQAIFWTFYDYYCQKNKKRLPVKRLWSDDVQVSTLKKALMNLRDEQTDIKLIGLKNSSLFRAIWDWEIGLNSTRAVTIKLGETTNVGRVKTPIDKILYDRENEIRNFIEETFYTLDSEFQCKNGSYTGSLVDEKNVKVKFKSKEEGEKVQKGLSKQYIANLDLKEKVINAQRCYSLSTLQSAGNSTFKYKLDKITAIVQSLYEKGIVSYPRTGSEYLTEAVALEIKPCLQAIHSIPNLTSFVSQYVDTQDIDSRVKEFSKNKNYVDNSEVEDHYAIIPTGKSFDFASLPTDEQNILTLICKRLLSIFMPSIKKSVTTVITSDQNLRFLTKGEMVLDKGFSVLYQDLKDKTLPKIINNETVDLLKSSVEEGKTTPPPRYTPSTLNDLLEDIQKLVADKGSKKLLKDAKGLGTPATRAGIVKELEENGFFTLQKNFIFPTDKCMDLMKSIGHLEISSPILTANCESFLRRLENSDKTLSNAECWRIIKDFVSKTIMEIKNMEMDTSHMLICPYCNNVIQDLGTFYKCGTDNCFSMGKKLMGANITKDDIKKILTNNPNDLVEKELYCKDSKWHVANLIYSDNKLSFNWLDKEAKNNSRASSSGAKGKNSSGSSSKSSAKKPTSKKSTSK